MLENQISNFIQKQFPKIYQEEGPFFVQFMTEYYKWLETDTTSPIYNARQHLSNHDIDTTVDEFILFYKEKYLKNIQINTATNTKQLIKNATVLYRAKGTENAIKLFFDLIFSEDSDVYYPGLDVFRLSDAKWVVPKYLEISTTPMNRLFVGRSITGINSNATAFVEKLVRRKVKNNYVEVIYISAISGDFQTGELIRLTTDINNNYDNNPQVLGSLNTVEIIDGGEGFTKGDIVSLSSRTGEEGKAVVDTLASITGIVDFELEDGGWGYSSNTNVFVSEKVLQLANVHIVSSANISLQDKITSVTQPMANVQWYNNTAAFSIGDTVYNYYANGVQIGVNTIISAEYGTNSTTNFFLLNTLSGNNFMDPSAAFYYTAGNTNSFQIQSAGWTDNTANAATDGISSNVVIYCTGSANTFTPLDIAYQISANNVTYANCTINSITETASNTFFMKVNGVNGLFLTNQPLYSETSGGNVAINSVSYDIGVRAITGTFRSLAGNRIINTANTSQWNGTIVKIPFGSGANTGIDSNFLDPEIVSLNTNFVRDHIDETINTNWVNATSYGSSLNFANLTNMSLANALAYEVRTLGTINALKNSNPGGEYTYAPFVDAVEPLVSPIGLHDFIIKISDPAGIYTIGEQVNQSIGGAKGLVKFANTSELHVRRLTFEDRWQVGNTSAYGITGVTSGHTAFPTEITYDIDSVAGHNAVIDTKVTSSNSTVENLIVTDSGFGFVDGDEITFSSSNSDRSGTSLGTVNKQGFGEGFYKSTSGFLSSNKYLFDGEYYQDLSYEIKSPISAERYSAMLKEVLHMCGMKVFSSIRKRITQLLTSTVMSKKHVTPTPAPSNRPVLMTSPVISGTAQKGQTLTSSTGSWTNSPTSYSYQWYRSSSPITGATSSTYLLTSLDVSQSITCSVVATNAGGSSIPAGSNSLIPIDLAPVNTLSPALSGTAQRGQSLLVSSGNWDNTPTNYTCQWKRNGTNISGATLNEYVLTSSDVSQTITAAITAINTGGSNTAISDSVVPIDISGSLLPVDTVLPLITGTNVNGSALTCSTGTWTNLPTSYSYQWKRNGVNISAATSASYTLTSSDVSATITCVVTATNIAGSVSASSSNSIIPIDLPPVNTVAPVISGGTIIGSILTCTTGTWTHSPTSYAYQWKNNGINIAGQTSSTYTTVFGDIGDTITCVVTATNSGGSVTATSNSIVPVSSGATYTYDNSIGVGSVDSAGFANLPLRSGGVAHRYYVNGSLAGASDSNAGTDPNLPWKTIAKVEAHIQTVSEYGKGHQYLIAEGTSYAERPPSIAFTDGGYSFAYPMVIQSYDPTDPTNEAKIGRANGTGSHARPKLTASTLNYNFGFTGNQNYIAIRGIEFNAGDIANQGAIGCVYAGSGFLIENCIFAYNMIGLDTSGRPNTEHWIIRNNAIYGSWNSLGGSLDGAMQGIYVNGCNSVTIEDNVIWSAGWRQAAGRGDGTAPGNAGKFSHAIYQQASDAATCVSRRNFIVDNSADGGSHRADALITNNVYLDNPITIGMGGGHGYDVRRPFGDAIDFSYNCAAGSQHINSSGTAGDWGVSSENGKPNGLCRAHHNVIAYSSANAGFAFSAITDFNQPSWLQADKNITYHWNNSGSSATIQEFGFTGTCHVVPNNNYWDDPASGTNLNVSSLVTAPYTGDALCAAAGYTNRATAIAYAIANPEQRIQRTILATGLARVSITPTLEDLGIESISSTGQPNAGQIINTLDGSTLTATGLPAHITLDNDTRTWHDDGSATTASSVSFSITETHPLYGSHTTNGTWTTNLAPILSSSTSSGVASTSATIGVTTDTGSGTLYWILSTSALETPLHPGEVELHHDTSSVNYAAYGNISISSSGAKTANPTGLTASTTYYLYWVQTITTGGRKIYSNVVDGGTITTAAPGVTTIYDTGMGASVDTSGFASLPLRTSDPLSTGLRAARTYFVNSSTGSDTYTATQAQNPATPLATVAKAFSSGYWLDGTGDQILVAENTTYSESPGIFAFTKGGYSALYPTVVQSYDPTDPTNTAKYGRASGLPGSTHARPVFSQCWNWFGGTGQGQIAMRGLDINPGNISGAASGGVDNGSNILFENCIFRYSGIGLSTNAQPLATNWIIRNCSIYGSYLTDSYGEGVYLSGGEGFTIEDCVFWNCGWKVGTTRDDPHDGANFFEHSFYQQHTSKGAVRRCIFIEGGQDGGSGRDDISYQNNLIIHCPIGLGLGGGNHYDLASPWGNALEARFNAIIECNDVNSTTLRGIGLTTSNGKPFSRIDYNVIAHSITAGTSGYAMQIGGFDNAASYAIIDHNVFWNACADAYASNHTVFKNENFAGTAHPTMTNNIWDDATSGSNTNRLSASVPNSAFNAASIVSTGGYADFNTMVQDLINHPENHTQRTLWAAAMAAYGVNTAPALIDVAMESSNGWRTGNRDSGVIIGTQEGVSLTFGGTWPTGFSYSSDRRMWYLDGTQSAGSGTGTITQVRSSDSAVKTTSINWTVATAPQLSAFSVSSPTTTTATINVTTTVGSGKLYWICDNADIGPKILPGEVHGGSSFNYHVYPFSGSQNVTSTGVQTINVTGLTGTDLYFSIMQIGGDGVTGTWSATSDGAHTLNSVHVVAGSGSAAPVLSSPTATAGGTTSASLGVTTNTGSGTLYWVVSTSSTAPTASQIEAGHDSTGGAGAAAGNQAVSASGVQSATASGLTAATNYYAYFVQNSGGDSNVVGSSMFTTLSGTSAFDTNPSNSSSDFTFTNSNKTVTRNTNTGNALVIGTLGKSATTGEGYFEISNIVPPTSGTFDIGVCINNDSGDYVHDQGGGYISDSRIDFQGAVLGTAERANGAGPTAWAPSTSSTLTSSNWALSGGNLTATSSGGGGLLATDNFKDTGYFEILVTNLGSGATFELGLTYNDNGPSASIHNDGIAYKSDGTVSFNGTSQSGTWASYAAGDKIGVFLDENNGHVYFSKNGTWQNSANPSARTGGIVANGEYPNFNMRPAVFANGSGAVVTLNVAGPFTYSIPTNGDPIGINDVIGFYMKNGKFWIRRNSRWQGVGGDPSAGGSGYSMAGSWPTVYPAVGSNGASCSFTINTGGSSFVYPIPTSGHAWG